MTQYYTHKQNDDEYYSPPFYTGPSGYKMRLKVYANGDRDGAADTRTHVSVYVHLVKGEYDSRLVWPFKGAITIQLVNHNNDEDHREYTVPFIDDGATDDASEIVQPTGERTIGWGKPYFISHTKVESTTETRRYMIDDCLTFRVTSIAVYSV